MIPNSTFYVFCLFRVHFFHCGALTPTRRAAAQQATEQTMEQHMEQSMEQIWNKLWNKPMVQIILYGEFEWIRREKNNIYLLKVRAWKYK